MTEENKKADEEKSETVFVIPLEKILKIIEREDGYYVQAGTSLNGPYKFYDHAWALWADLYYGT